MQFEQRLRTLERRNCWSQTMAQRFVCSAWMGAHAVNIFSDTDAFVEPLRATGRFIPFIPGWYCTETPADTLIRLCFVQSTNTEVLLSPSSQSLTVYGPSEAFADGEGIAYWAYFLLEIERQRHGETTAHGAACSKAGRGVLLFGERGAGKTS